MISYCLILDTGTTASVRKLSLFSIFQFDVTAYLAVWYLGNIYYNIYNKKACIALGKNAAGASNAHWALSAVQVKRQQLMRDRNKKIG